MECEDGFAPGEDGEKCVRCENDCEECKWVSFTRSIFGRELRLGDSSCITCKDDQIKTPVRGTNPEVYVCKDQ